MIPLVSKHFQHKITPPKLLTKHTIIFCVERGQIVRLGSLWQEWVCNTKLRTKRQISPVHMNHAAALSLGLRLGDTHWGGQDSSPLMHQGAAEWRIFGARPTWKKRCGAINDKLMTLVCKQPLTGLNNNQIFYKGNIDDNVQQPCV